MTQHHWATITEKGKAINMMILLWIYKLAGKSIVWVIMVPIITIYWLTSRVARTASREYLSRALGRPSTALDSWRHFQHFGRMVLDKVDAWLGTLKIEQLKIETPDKFEHVWAELRAGNGALFIGSHHGNIELMRALSIKQKGMKITILMYTKNSKQFTKFFKFVDERTHINLFEVDKMDAPTAIALQQRIADGHLVIITGDRVPVNNDNATEVHDFFGHPAKFAQGPFILASLLGCPVYSFFCMRSHNHYHAYLYKIVDKLTLPRKNREAALSATIQTYIGQLEQMCRRYPYEWFNFYPYWQA